MFSTKRVGAILAIAMLVCAGSVAHAARGDKGDREIGVFAGVGFADDFDLANGTGALEPDDGTIFGVRYGGWLSERWGLEGSFQRLMSEFGTGPQTDVEIDSIRLNGLYNFRPGKNIRPFITLGIGHEDADYDGLMQQNYTGLNAGAGFRYWIDEIVGLRFDTRLVNLDTRNPIDSPQNNIETTVGVLWAWGGSVKDADGDGVRDSRDRCPDTPRGAVVDEQGCPKDSDGDGVYDGIDACPDTPKGHAVDARGCSLDSDGDGVNDALDRCPDTPKGAKVDADGCPKDTDGDGVYDGIDRCPDTPKGAKVDANGCTKDSDGDGVADGIDRCPNTPKGAKVDANGCAKDSDGDGVADGIDRCPSTPAGRRVDANGCEVLFEKEKDTLVLRGVKFEFNSDKLTADSRKILDSVAESLTQSNRNVRIEVGGHTDSKGAASYNQKLSDRRAESVRKYLIGRGIAGTRIESRGYGESKPVADNATDAGRAENRRVELKRID